VLVVFAACPESASSTPDGGDGGVAACDVGFTLQDGGCVATLCAPNASRACPIDNGTGSQVCDASGSGWSFCANITSCNDGYTFFDSACPATQRVCSVSDGTGEQTFADGGYGACVATACDPDYALNNGACVAKDPGKVSLTAGKWNITWSQGMPPNPYPVDGGWALDFPVLTGDINQCADYAGSFVIDDLSSMVAHGNCPTLNYVTTAYTTPIASTSTLSITLQINTTGAPVFNYRLDATNTCVSPAHVRAMIQHVHDDYATEGWRFWANPTAYELGPGTVTMQIPMAGDQWSDVLGKFGTADAGNLAGFEDTLANVGRVGFVFGGGCFFGHGVNISGGTAQLVVTDFSFR
jgi:hypothetical protein